MPANHETTRVRNLPDDDKELLDYIDANGTKSPEREHALHVLSDRHERRNQQKFADLTEVIRESSAASDGLGKKVYFLNWILAIATITGAAATVVMAWEAWNQPSSVQTPVSTELNTDQQ